MTRSERVPGPAHVRPEAGAALSPPVTDPGELVQLLTVLIEDARDAVAAERALAGAVRLSALPERAPQPSSQAPLLQARQADRPMHTYVAVLADDQITSDIALLTPACGRARRCRSRGPARARTGGTCPVPIAVSELRAGADDGRDLLGPGLGGRERSYEAGARAASCSPSRKPGRGANHPGEHCWTGSSAMRARSIAPVPGRRPAMTGTSPLLRLAPGGARGALGRLEPRLAGLTPGALQARLTGSPGSPLAFRSRHAASQSGHAAAVRSRVAPSTCSPEPAGASAAGTRPAPAGSCSPA